LRPCCPFPYDREPCITSYALTAQNRQQLRKDGTEALHVSVRSAPSC
jgi:hypothetical protein